jgi:hypothetical protein
VTEVPYSAVSERAALEALRRAQAMSTSRGDPVVSHGWVTVYMRPGDWKALCMWRDENTPKTPDPATCKHDWILVPPGDDHCKKCGAYR